MVIVYSGSLEWATHFLILTNTKQEMLGDGVILFVMSILSYFDINAVFFSSFFFFYITCNNAMQNWKVKKKKKLLFSSQTKIHEKSKFPLFDFTHRPIMHYKMTHCWREKIQLILHADSYHSTILG